MTSDDTEFFEQIVNNPKLEDKSFCQSPKYYDNMFIALDKIKNSNVGTYIIFGHDAFTTYAFYKSKNHRFYIISDYLNEEHRHCEIHFGNNNLNLHF